jgi:hypothetical protein
MTEIITGLVTSFVTLAGSYFIFKNNDKSNQLKYITEERQKWREKMRELSVSFMSGRYVDNEFLSISEESELINIREQVAVRLNPDDEEDKYILCLMDCYIEHKDYRQTIRKELSKAFASLLKHDWERAKNESKMESNSTRLLIVFMAFLFASIIFEWCGYLPESIDLSDSKIIFLHPVLIICKFILFILMNLVMYKFLQLLKCIISYLIEKKLSSCLKNKPTNNESQSYECCSDKSKTIKQCLYKCKSNSNVKRVNFCTILNKYLGYTIRRKISKE